MLDLEFGAHLIRVQLDSSISITINFGFVYFLTNYEENHTMDIIDTQENEAYGRASSCDDDESGEEEPWPEELLHTPLNNSSLYTTLLIASQEYNQHYNHDGFEGWTIERGGEA